MGQRSGMPLEGKHRHVDRRVSIRPPLARIWIVGFSIFWCGFLIVSSLPPDRDPVGLVVTAGMLVFGVGLGYRLLRLGASTEGDVLVIRNNFRTRRLARREIEAFRVGEVNAGLPIGRAIFVLLTDESVVQIDGAMSLGPLGGGRLDRTLSDLRRWLDEQRHAQI